MQMRQAIAFVTTPQGRVAFATSGSGPPLLCDTGWVSHLNYMWQLEAYRNFYEQLAAHTVIRYDKLGTGLSDRNRTDFTYEPDVQAVEAVVDRLGLKRLSFLGMSQGGPVAALYAARHPDRVDRLIFYGTWGRGLAIGPGDVQRSLVALARAHWGLGSKTLADLFVAGCDTATQEWFTRCQRVAADAETAARLLELIYATDVSRELASIQAPSLVLHREGDRAVPFAAGREVAGLIPGAHFEPLPGKAHLPYFGETEPVLRAILNFLPPAPVPWPLTRREADVVGLVAAGLTNAEIAQRLSVAPRTVDAHVEHIRNKLGFRSRTQIGVWAAERQVGRREG